MLEKYLFLSLGHIFFSCRQRQDESFKMFVLRLRELYCRLRRRSPEGALVEDQQGGPGRVDSRLQETDWKAELKREILEEVKGQMRELTQEMMKELKSSSPVAQLNHAQPNYVPFQPQTVSSRRQRGQSSLNMWDAEGRPICRHCQQSGHIARYCKESVLPNGDLN